VLVITVHRRFRIDFKLPGKFPADAAIGPIAALFRATSPRADEGNKNSGVGVAPVRRFPKRPRYVFFISSRKQWDHLSTLGTTRLSNASSETRGMGEFVQEIALASMEGQLPRYGRVQIKEPRTVRTPLAVQFLESGRMIVETITSTAYRL